MKRFVIAALAAFAATAALADYPDHPITIVVPFSAGGPTDKVARDLAEALRKPLGQSVIVENVGGAGGTLGAARVARSSNDGYTILLHHIGIATSPALYRKLPYDTLNDFEYLGMVNEVPMENVGLEWEPCHQMVSLIDPIPQLRKLAATGKIFHVHGKDATLAWDIVREFGIRGGKQYVVLEI